MRLGKLVSIVFVICISAFSSMTQEPAPGALKSGQVPVVREKRLANGLMVAVGERRSIPLVTIQLLIKSGASDEDLQQAGLADLTAGLLTKGTKTRTATQIAEAIEFLGGSISSSAGWNSSNVTVTVTSDRLDQALAVLADVVLNPSFKQDEIDLLKSQTLDGLKYNLKQPGFLANYVASRYTFGEHPAGGTPASIGRISRNNIERFHQFNYRPENSVLIFAGDIAFARANAAAQIYFGRWRSTVRTMIGSADVAGLTTSKLAEKTSPRRILVIDLPDSGQAAVKYLKQIDVGRVECSMPTPCAVSGVFFPATVMNSLLGGGYSSRLNQEIRIKRGLSYGAGSSFAWRRSQSNFSTSTQTKNESAAEVAKLVLEEIGRLGETNYATSELDPRKMVLTGDFGRDLETTGGIAARIADLYSYDLKPIEMNEYVRSVRAVTGDQIRAFANGSLGGGDVVIVGDAKIFMDDLKKRFLDLMIIVIAADALDLEKDNLRK